jgi:hypothetical protein
MFATRMPFGIQPGQQFVYTDCFNNKASAYAFCSTLVQSKTPPLTVVSPYTTSPAANEVPQGSIVNNLRLTTANPNSPCGLQENDRFFNEANGAGYADKCSVTVLFCYAVSAEMLLNLPQAVAVNDSCLTELWNANERCRIITNMIQHYWNKYPVDAFGTLTPPATESVPVVNMGAKSMEDLGCNCWYTFSRRDETLRINIDNLDTTPFPVGSTIQFVATFSTMQLVPSLDCIRPLGSVELTPVQPAAPGAVPVSAGY